MPPGEWPWTIGLIGGFVLMLGVVGVFTARLWKVSEPIILRSSAKAMLRKPGGELRDELGLGDHHRHAGPPHGLRQVGIHRLPAAGLLERLQLIGGQLPERWVLRRPSRQHSGHRLEHDRLLGPDRAGRHHRQ